MSLKSNLSDQLNWYRAGQTIVEFSSSLGIGKTSLKRFVSGKGNPSLGTIEHMAEHLDVEPVTLVSPLERTLPEPVRRAKCLLHVVPILCKLPRENRPKVCDLLVELTCLCDLDHSGKGGDET